MTTNGNYQNEPRPRLCHLHRRPDFDGYGFNLHCDRNKSGQFIGKVDAHSPAESAGLKEDDRIIEVNYVCITNENHKQAVTRIKEGVTRNDRKHPDEVILLVVDQKTDDFYTNQGRIPKSSDHNVDKFETDMRDYSDNASNSSRSSTRSAGGGSFSRQESSHSNQHNTRPINNNHASPAISRTSDQDSERTGNDNPNGYHRQQSSKPIYTNIHPSNRSPSPPPLERPRGQPENTLNLQMSAAEYRQQLTRNSRRRDPRLAQQMSMKQKHDVVNNL